MVKKKTSAVQRTVEPRVRPEPLPSWYPYGHLGDGGLVFSGNLLRAGVAGAVVDTLSIAFGPLWCPRWAVVDVEVPCVLRNYLHGARRFTKAPGKPLAIVLVPGFDERFQRKAARLGVAIIEVSAK